MDRKDRMGSQNWRRRAYGVKVNRLPTSVSASELYERFARYGNVDSVDIKKGDGENYAFVNFLSEDEAKRACEAMNGNSIRGRKIGVKMQGESFARSPTQHTVKITGLSKLTDEATVEECFSFSHNVNLLNCKLVECPIQAYNFAYANYSSREDAIRAESQLNGLLLHNCSIKVKYQDAASTHQITSTSQWHSATLLSAAPCFSPTTSQSPVHSFPLVGSSVVQPWQQQVVSSNRHAPPTCTVKVSIDGELEAEDLAEVFGQYGFIKGEPKVVSGSPNYAYVNFSTPAEASRANAGNVSSIKGVRVQVKLSGKGLQSSQDCKHLPCDRLTWIALCAHHKNKLQQIREAEQVVIKHSKEGTGINIWGDISKLDSACDDISTLLEEVRNDIQCLTFTLPCHFLPLFKDSNTVVHIASIEDKHGVEFGVVACSPQECVYPFQKFQEVIAGQFSKPGISTSSKRVASVEAGDTVVKASSFSQFLKPNSTSSKYQWLWENDDGKYVPYIPAFSPYTATDADAIEQMYTSGQPGILAIHGKTYTFNFSAMKQTNTETGYQRSIKRVDDQTTAPAASAELSFQVRGVQSSLQPAVDELKEEISLAVTSCIVHIPCGSLQASSDPELRDTLVQRSSEYLVTAVIHDGQINLQGIQGYVEHVATQLRLDIATYQSKSKPSLVQSQTPMHWQAQERKIEVVPVQAGGSEWNHVLHRMQKTLPAVQITSLERVQNMWLWEKYALAKKRMAEKNGGVINEIELFHGTRSTPPEKIYKSEQGFDFRYASQGLWGEGVYFAVNASYSDCFSFCTSSGMKQMILAQVLTGETYRCHSDRSLKMPPLKTHSRSMLAGAGTFEDERYDSVSGHHPKGTDVFVIYDFEKAYPAYLITFT